MIRILIIAAVSLVVFYPSFQHTFRSDQIVYFANTRGHTDVIALWKNYYAYEHVRHYNPGDAYLFRPLLSMLLGFEKGVFNTHYANWHILGFLLHLLTVLCLFRILSGLKAGIFAFLCALWYACCFANVEIVIWEHINGYLIFNALILASIFYFKKSVDDAHHRKDLVWVWVFLLIASFLHEWGFLFSLLFAVCLYFNNKIWIFFLPPVFYTLTYGWVNWHYQTEGLVITEIFSKSLQFSNLVHALKLIPSFFGHLIYNGLFPSQIKGNLNIMDRLIFVRASSFTPVFLLNLAAVSGVGLLICQGFSRTMMRRHKLFILLLLGMVACQFITLLLIRLPTHGKGYIFQSLSYYGYMFWSYFLVIVFMAVDWEKINGRRLLKCLSIVSLLVLIFLNAYQTWQINRAIKSQRWAWQEYIDKLNKFIAVHGKEPGFSFYVEHDLPIRLKYNPPGSSREATEQLNLASILYYPYYNPQHPKYVFFLEQDGHLFYSPKMDFTVNNNFLGSKGLVRAE